LIFKPGRKNSMENKDLKKIDDVTWENPKSEGMKVPGRIYASEKLLKQILKDESIKQVKNVACLPGVVGYSMAMPDIHWGYGFPIGGVAATDIRAGVISPGGVGYDINCGVRLIRTELKYEEIKGKIKDIVAALFNAIPTGVGSHGAIKKLSKGEVRKVLLNGARWAVEHGYGDASDLRFIEEGGMMDGADPGVVSNRAYERGASQLGTLGSGNHFVEISVVRDIYNGRVANILGLRKGQVVILIHTGSRGLGYQICDDYLKVTLNAVKKYGINIPDRQLACAPIESKEGQDYIAAMKAAANFAFANRQVISSLVRDALLQTLNISLNQLGFKLVWDIAHNIAKIEEHEWEGRKIKVCVHRKGATRAFGPGSSDIPDEYKDIGQPVLVPGDMGTESYVCVGTEKAMKETFGSSCHGAGRVLSRRQAKQKSSGISLEKEMEKYGVYILADTRGTIAEEMPYAYKDVTEVVNTMNKAGIVKKVARFTPIGVIKG